MSTKYTVTAGGTERKTVSKKQAAIDFGDGLGESYQVLTDKGTVVHEVTVPAPDQGQADRTGPSARTGVPTDNPVAEKTEPLPDEVVDDAAEPLFYESIDFPGNYSIVTAPGAVEIAEAAGVPAKIQTFGMALTRRVWFGGPDMDKAQAVVALVQKTTDEALVNLKEWQRKNLERRRTLTDQQRYLEHREQIAKHFTKVAKAVKKEGLS